MDQPVASTPAAAAGIPMPRIGERRADARQKATAGSAPVEHCQVRTILRQGRA
jgi:hypothetical protein